jgi:hypothetical protein
MRITCPRPSPTQTAPSTVDPIATVAGCRVRASVCRTNAARRPSNTAPRSQVEPPTVAATSMATTPT